MPQEDSSSSIRNNGRIPRLFEDYDLFGYCAECRIESKAVSVRKVCTEMCKFMGKELRETAPAARGREEAGFTQFLTHKSTLLSMKVKSQ